MRSAKYAVYAGLASLLVGSLHVVFSSAEALTTAATVSDFRTVIVERGLAFTVVASLAAAAVVFILSKRFEQARRDLDHLKDELARVERRVLAAHLASGIAHDFKNHLTVIRGAFEELQLSLPPDRTSEEVVDDLRVSLDDATQLAENLSRIGLDSTPPGSVRSVDLTALTDRTLRILRRHPHLIECKLEIDLDPDVAVHCFPPLVIQALSNLVLNAAEASGGHGRVRVHVEADKGRGIVEVHDDGPGVPPDDHDRLFAPFFTTKHDGTGLGLLSVRACAQYHHGNVEVVPSPLGGACFRLTLPPIPGA